ncbi:MAG: thiol reductant ABC exporter subunit CydD [Anaerolineaceae bacterium]|nr:thiol reductant ABC exporter subunit CydD [Anaerolineaceae bacterium]
MNIDRRLLFLARKVWFYLGLAVMAGLLGALLVILQARFLSQIVAEVFLNGQTLRSVQPLLWILLVIMLVRGLTTYGSGYLASLASIQIKTSLREVLFRHILSLGPAYLQLQESGDLVTTLMQEVEGLDAYFSQYLPQLALAALIPLMILVVVFPMDLITGVVLLLTAPLIPIFMVLIGNTAQAITRRQWTALRRLSAHFLDTLQGLTTLKALNQSAAQADKITRVSENYRKATINVLRVSFISALVLELVGAISTAIVAVEIGLRLLNGGIQFEQAFFILVIAPEFYLPLRQLGMRFHASASGISAANRIFQILAQPVPQELKTGQATSAWTIPPTFRLSFEGVRFSYPQREEAALNGVNFEIPSGQLTALVGPSGSGKSTIAQLLLRFLNPQSGQICLNGQSIQGLPCSDWRSQIAWVPQSPYLYNCSIAENIRLGRSEATFKEIRQAAQQANLDEFIQSLPEGFDTLVGERGARLSGGQAQRLALARAFLRNPALLLMDEPTAHLDPEQEAFLQPAIKRLCQNRTTLLIAHRLATVINANNIIVLDHGRVVESGSHAALLANNGLYAQLVGSYEGSIGASQ